MRAHSRRIALGAAAIAVVLAFGLTMVHAQGVPGVSPNKCLAGKTKCVNKKVAGLLKCREKCQKDPSKCGGGGGGGPQDACEAKVIYKFDGGTKGPAAGCFAKLEAKQNGGAPETICTTTGDAVPMEAMADIIVADVVGALEGNLPPVLGAFPATGQTTSYGPDSDGNIQAGATLDYQDNGDGTITDLNTGLMWEKKSNDGGIHDKDNEYTWGMTSSPYTMNGTIVTSFLAGLNAGAGFAGHTDWRIPNVKELQSIVNYQVPYPGPVVSYEFNNNCTSGCSVLTCSCTVSSYYWSSTTNETYPYYAWYVNFTHGTVGNHFKDDDDYVRAVRGGS